jgi:DNA-directed RNA polymerase specialized sigma subunit
VLVDTREYLDVLLRSLSERERNILQAHYLEERPFNEIDPFSGHAARQVAFRAMKKVRKKAPATAK